MSNIANKEDMLREIMAGEVQFSRDEPGGPIYLVDEEGWLECDQDAVRELLCDEIPNIREEYVEGWGTAKPTGRTRWRVC